MILVDTSVWIEFLRGNPEFNPPMAELLESGQVLAADWVFGELLQGTRSRQERDILMGYVDAVPSVQGARIWIEAGVLSSERRLAAPGVGLIDAALVVAARMAGAKIWTLDRKLRGILRSDEIYEP